jgi:hypothetical protein
MTMKRLLFLCGLTTLPFAACECNDGSSLRNVAPHLVYEPQSLEFGEVPIGKDRTVVIRLTNEGESPLPLNGATATSDTDAFSLPEALRSALAPKQSIEFPVKFTALAAGELTGTLVIEADDSDGRRTINLRGTGVVPGIMVNHDGTLCNDAPGSLSFGTVAPGQTVERTLTLEATGSAPVTVLSAAIIEGASAEWTLEAVPETGIELVQGTRLELTATYTPADSGADTAAFLITTNVPNRMNIRIGVCGAGAAPAMCGSPVPLDLGRVAVNADGTGDLTIQNCSTDTFALTGLEIVDDAVHPSDDGFSLSTVSTLPLTLAAGESMVVTAKLNSGLLGTKRGYIRATSSAPTQPEAFFAVLADVRDTCELLLAPERVVFNNVVTGATARRTVLMANNGADVCAVSRIAFADDPAGVFSFIEVPSLPFSLAAGESESLVIRYAPENSAIPDEALLEVESGATVHRVDLLGNPMVPPGCHLEVSQSFINWGAVTPGYSILRGVELRNISEFPCDLTGAELDSASSTTFTHVQVAPGRIDPGTTTTVLVNFRAPAMGTSTGLLHIRSNDVTLPVQDVQLLGEAAQAGICVTPTLLDFGATSSGTLDVDISACGASPITVTDLAFTRPDVEIQLRNPPTLPVVLNPGENLVVTVLYESNDNIGDSGVFTVGSNDPVKPTVNVNVTAGPVIVPPTAGRYLYYWEIDLNGRDESNIYRMPLQGQPIPEPYWGPANGKICSGCHGVAPDGRYVAVIEADSFRMTVIDTQTDIEVALPFQVLDTAFFTWNPDVNANPPYQFAYDDGLRIHTASIVAGYLGELQGANDPQYGHKMPSWGANGKIAFARGAPDPGWSFYGPCDIMLIDETGGVPVALNGASANGAANYYPAFHPNGQWVAFNQSLSAQGTLSAQDGRIYMAPTDQSGTVAQLPNLNVPVGQGASSFPTWSLDGNFLSFSSNRNTSLGSWDLYLSAIDPATGADLPAFNIVEANSADFQHAARWSD